MNMKDFRWIGAETRLGVRRVRVGVRCGMERLQICGRFQHDLAQRRGLCLLDISYRSENLPPPTSSLSRQKSTDCCAILSHVRACGVRAYTTCTNTQRMLRGHVSVVAALVAHSSLAENQWTVIAVTQSTTNID